MKSTRKYERPSFLPKQITQADYESWLTRKATTHLKRDRKRRNTGSTREQYKLAIHDAVVTSKGLDAYTGKELRWDQISTYDNTQSKAEGCRYKTNIGDLPTVDHTGDGTGERIFRICSWKVNDAKNDLTLEEFLDLCDCVLAFNRQVKPAQSKEGHEA